MLLCMVDLVVGFVVDDFGNLMFLYVGVLKVVGLIVVEVQVCLKQVFGKIYCDFQVML